jgi:hypothetical protein
MLYSAICDPPISDCKLSFPMLTQSRSEKYTVFLISENWLMIMAIRAIFGDLEKKTLDSGTFRIGSK